MNLQNSEMKTYVSEYKRLKSHEEQLFVLRATASTQKDKILESMYVGLLNTLHLMYEKSLPSIEEIVDEKVKVLEVKRKYRG